MTDMNPFEQELSAGFKGLMGPSEPVDDAAIFSAITTTQSPKWRFQYMFSATKFVVAGAVVALFGGFLLSGVLVQPPTDQQMPGAGASASDSPVVQVEATPAGSTPTTAVTGRFGVDIDRQPAPEATALAGGGEREIALFPHVPVDVSDPRLDGDLTALQTTEVRDGIRYSVLDMRIETDDGAWQAEPIFFTSIPAEERSSDIGDTAWVGEGAYDGLLLVAYLDPFGAGFDLEGYIVESDLPPTPEATATTK